MEKEKQTIDEAIQSDKEKLQKFSNQTNNVVNLIVAKTLARHNDLSEADYLKRIGFGNKNVSEEKAVKIARFNIMQELTKAIIELNGRLSLLKETAKLFLTADENDKIEEEERENG